MVVIQSGVLKAEAPSLAAQRAFASAPWCASILSNPSVYQPIHSRSRVPKADKEDEVLAVTLAADETVAAWHAFYLAAPLPSSWAQPPVIRGEDVQDAKGQPLAAMAVLLSLGRGLDGHSGMLHGGFSCFLFDECITLLASLHRSPDTSGMTATLTVDYKKAISTPGIILCRTWLEGRSGGRKLFLRASLEDGEGGVFAIAKALVIEVTGRPSKM